MFLIILGLIDTVDKVVTIIIYSLFTFSLLQNDSYAEIFASAKKSLVRRKRNSKELLVGQRKCKPTLLS